MREAGEEAEVRKLLIVFLIIFCCCAGVPEWPNGLA